MFRRSVLLLSLVVSAGAAGVGLACGTEAVGTDLTAQDGSAGSSSGDASSGGSGSTGSSGNSGVGARRADEAGVTANGGVDPPDAGPGGDTTTIACGSTSCPIPAETCCVSDLKSGGSTSFVCVAGTSCPTSANVDDTAALKCSGAANCPAGTVCCVRVGGGDQASSECRATCESKEAQLCDPNVAVSGCTPAEPCSNDSIGDWNLPKTFATCGGKGN